MKPPIFILLVIGACALTGCGDAAAPPAKADSLAVSDPDAKARQLLADFNNAEDQKGWVQQNNFSLAVFQTVKDPQLKAEYQSKIAPMLDGAK